MIKGLKLENEYLVRQIETLRKVTVTQRADINLVSSQLTLARPKQHPSRTYDDCVLMQDSPQHAK